MRVLACALAITACSSDKTLPPAPPPEPPKAAPPPKQKLEPKGESGSCTLKVSGAFTADETTTGGAQSKHWQSTAELPGLIVNCTGKDVRISVVPAPGTDVPYGPKTYKIEKRGDLVVLGRAGKPLQDFAGAVTVTAFDGAHVAGTIALRAKQTGGGAVAIDGTFEFRK